jgi:hypothetical protein
VRRLDGASNQSRLKATTVDTYGSPLCHAAHRNLQVRRTDPDLDPGPDNTMRWRLACPVFGDTPASRTTEHRSVAGSSRADSTPEPTAARWSRSCPLLGWYSPVQIADARQAIGLKIAHPATDRQHLCGAPWREQRAAEVPDGGSNRCPAPLRTCTTSTSTSLPPLADDAVSPIPVEAVTFGSAAMVLAYVHYRG